MISHTLTVDERNSLITSIFLDHNQVELLGQLSESDSQDFVDAIDEASSTRVYIQSTSLIDLDTNMHVLSIRLGMALDQRSAGSVDAIYTRLVAAKPYFRGRYQFLFVTTQRRTRYAMVDFRMCGRVGMLTRMSQSRF